LGENVTVGSEKLAPFFKEGNLRAYFNFSRIRKDNSGRLSTKFEQASLQTKQNFANLIGPSTAGFLDTKGAIKTFPPW